MFVVNDYISENVRRNDQFALVPSTDSHGRVIYLAKHGEYCIARLSSSSKIVMKANAEHLACPPCLSGVFVSDILVWTFEDSQRYDLEHHTNFSDDWCDAAMSRGFVYVVDFAGYAR